MALPTSGPLKFSTIYTELYGSHTSQVCSLRNMSADAGYNIPDNVSEFYGYTSKSLSASQTEFTGVTFRGGTGIVSFDVVSNSVNWSASATTNPSNFITIQSGDESGGDGTKTVDLDIAANSDKNNTRYGEVTISDDDTNDPVADIVIKITQNKQYYFSVTESFELASAANSSDSVSLSTNVSNWTASVSTNFSDNSLSVSSSGNTITVTVSTENTASSPRNGEIKVHDNSTADPADDLIITVSQAGSLNISVSPNNFTGVTWRGTTKQSTVTSTNVNWTESHDTSIVSNVSPDNGGDGDTDITITIDDYADTTADRTVSQAVTISGSGITKYISITQNYKRYISASNTTFDYDATTGTITVGGNVPTTWDVASYTSNFLNSASRTNDTTLSVTMDENTSTSDNTDTITIKDTGTDPADNITITVTQEAAPELSADVTNLNVDYNDDTYHTINVTANVNWNTTITSGSSNITIQNGDGNNNGSFNVKFNNKNTDKNNTVTATIKLYDEGGEASDVIINCTQNKAKYIVKAQLICGSTCPASTMLLTPSCHSGYGLVVAAYKYGAGGTEIRLGYNSDISCDAVGPNYTAEYLIDITDAISWGDDITVYTVLLDANDNKYSGSEGDLVYNKTIGDCTDTSDVEHHTDGEVKVNGTVVSGSSFSASFTFDVIDSVVSFAPSAFSTGCV